MTDIVERLRFEAKWARGEDGGIPEFVKLTVEEAADEIERLRAALLSVQRMFRLDLYKQIANGPDYNQALKDVSDRVNVALAEQEKKG